MFKTIFGKQFAFYMGALAISFGILGIALITLFQNFLIAQKKLELISMCEKIENAVVGYFDIFNDPRTPINELHTISRYTDISFFITTVNSDSSMDMLAYTVDLQRDDINEIVKLESLQPILEGSPIAIKGTLNNLYKENTLTIGYPVYKKSYSSQVLVAAIFINSSLSEIERTTRDFVRLIAVCLLISAVISFILVYFSSKTISDPIRRISEAAKVIADGNFEKRIELNSKDEVGQLAGSFNYMAENLYNQEIYRREFIANISHDLRSPLTSIKGFLQAIIDGTVPQEKRDRYLNIVMDETERVAKLANDILDISKLQNIDVELNYTDFDINELIRQTVVLLESRITSKQIEMNISFAEEKTNVTADRDKIQRVIYNLTDNAVKFTNSLGIISIETKPRQSTKDNEKIEIVIKDSGIGISPDDQKRVFDRFYKADSSRGEDKKGSGLGLSIVREFIKAHGETVEIYSELNKGCTFVFTLPISKPVALQNK